MIPIPLLIYLAIGSVLVIMLARRESFVRQFNSDMRMIAALMVVQFAWLPALLLGLYIMAKKADQ